MKKFITGIIAIASLALSASAQTQKNEDMNRDAARSERRALQENRINPRLLESLDLTVSQKEQIRLINEDYRNKMQDMIKSDAPAEDRKAKRTVLEIDKKNKIMKLLTADQAKKLKELRASDVDEHHEYKEKIKADGEETKVKIKND